MEVLQAGDERDCLKEPVGSQRSGDLGAEYLESDLTGMPQVLGEIDGRHPAAADFPNPSVTVRQGVSEIL
jgi:hypothetical protein